MMEKNNDRERRDELFDCFVASLDGDMRTLDKIIDEFRLEKPLGNEIIIHLNQFPAIKDKAEDLLDQCLKRKRGLVLLKTASQKWLPKNGFEAFAKVLSDYSQNDDVVSPDDKLELYHGSFFPTLPKNSNIENLEIAVRNDLDKARIVLYRMSRPGEAFASRSLTWAPAEKMIDSDFHPFILNILDNSSPEIQEQFIQRMRQEDADEDAFLLILVEDITTIEGERFRLRAEIVTPGQPEPVNLHRSLEGAYPVCSKDDVMKKDLPAFIGQLIQIYKPYFPLFFLEVFLPSDFFYEDFEIMVDLPVGKKVNRVALSHCGYPAVLRFLARARKAKQIPSIGSFSKGKSHLPTLTSKWNCLQRNQGKLHPINDPTRLKSESIHQFLAPREVVGALFLIDLPDAREQREEIFETIIESQIPVCLWWKRPCSEEASEINEGRVAINNEMKAIRERLSCLSECLCVDFETGIKLEKFYSGGPENISCSDAFYAPSHLHAMETVGRKVQELAKSGSPWISDLCLLIDHPQRWPTCILTENREGRASFIYK